MVDGTTLQAQFARDTHESGVWRFSGIIYPAREHAISHPEGNTPLLERGVLSAWCGMSHLHIKHEGHNPTGSFKDRGMTVAVSHARRLGVPAVACASTGNTSASLASYAAHAGLPAIVFVPAGQVAPEKLAQTAAYGARILLVEGDFDAALRLARGASEALGVYLVNSVNPFRIEGQKTIVFEMMQQLGWQAPDWIVLPAGNLGNTAAFGKALAEALRWGLIDRMPRLAAIQASGAAPFAAAFHRGFDALVPVTPTTVASAIRIGAPASYARGVGAIRSTRGVVTTVSDDELMAAKAEIDRCGVGCEPASAVSIAGLRKLVAAGTINPGANVVAVLTGHLLKGGGIGSPGPWERITPTLGEVERVLRRSQ